MQHLAVTFSILQHFTASCSILRAFCARFQGHAAAPRAASGAVSRRALELGAADGEAFMRLALSTESPYAILQVKPEQRSATFQLYGIETMPLPGSRERVLRSNSKFRLELWGDDAD